MEELIGFLMEMGFEIGLEVLSFIFEFAFSPQNR